MTNPTNQEFQKRFDSIAANYDDISNQYTIRRRAESLQIIAAGSVLEVGSGTGIVTESINTNVICTDISFKMCMHAKSRRTSIVCCDAEFLPFKENSFDSIISAEMIYYLKNPDNFISAASKILRKDGKLWISMTNHDMAIINKIRSLLRNIGVSRTYFDDGIREFLKLEYLQLLLEKHNFKINSIEKKVIFPFKSFDKINRLLEKSPLNYFCIFIIVKAVSNKF